MYCGGGFGYGELVIGWGLRRGLGLGVWCLAHFWHEISDLFKSLGISFWHVQREQNTIAGKLTNLEVEVYSNFRNQDSCVMLVFVSLLLLLY